MRTKRVVRLPEERTSPRREGSALVGLIICVVFGIAIWLGVAYLLGGI